MYYTIQRDSFLGSNFRVFRATEPFHEYLTHVTLLSWVEFEQYRSKNEILTQILIITQKLDTTKISCYTVHNYLFFTDIDECAVGFSDYGSSGGSSTNGSLNSCSQICTNTNGSFICECFSGYQLNDDLMTCVGMQVIYIPVYLFQFMTCLDC